MAPLSKLFPPRAMADTAAMRTPGLRHIAISVADFDGAHEQLKTQGVTFAGEPYETQGNRLLFFRDADGNLIHLIQRSNPLPSKRA